MAKKEKLIYERGVKPTSAAAINAEYIVAFYADKVESGEITQKQLADWTNFVEKVQSGDDSDMKKFATIRKEFIKRNFPGLAKKEKVSMLDALKALQK